MNEINLFYGTWELDGILKNISFEEGIKLLKYAKLNGINKFDTALVYANGKVERMLSNVIDDRDIVLTKIPAIKKPEIDEIKIDEFYPIGYVNDKVNESLKNLNRKMIDIILLHNWSKNWKDLRVLDELIKLKEKGVIKHIGISLPNNFNYRLDLKILKKIDYLEAPYNIENTWILNDLDYYKENNIKIILRSLFLQGKLIKEKKVNKDEVLSFIQKLNVYVTIGMTNQNQIDENIKYFGG